MLDVNRYKTNTHEAKSLIPAKIETNGHISEDIVRTLMAASLKASKKVQIRIQALDKMSEDNRAIMWKYGPEEIWFCDYSNRKFRSLRENFEKVSHILAEKRLRIICHTNKSNWGDAWPAIRKIKLGSLWINSNKRLERIQTFIHEASHIAGRAVAKEGQWYGRTNAQTMAKNTRNQPMKVMRSADNLGYYAIDVAFS